jgi:hypothetical protein
METSASPHTLHFDIADVGCRQATTETFMSVSLEEVVRDCIGWMCVFRESDGTTEARITRLEIISNKFRHGLEISINPTTVNNYCGNGWWASAANSRIQSWFFDAGAAPGTRHDDAVIEFEAPYIGTFWFVPPGKHFDAGKYL